MKNGTLQFDPSKCYNSTSVTSPENGSCDTSKRDSCFSSNQSINRGQNLTHYYWTCPGSNGGTNAFCSMLIPFVYNPADIDSNKTINSTEINAYNNAFKQGTSFLTLGIPSQANATRAHYIYAKGAKYNYTDLVSCPGCWYV
jgi:hypothetical protein